MVELVKFRFCYYSFSHPFFASDDTYNSKIVGIVNGNDDRTRRVWPTNKSAGVHHKETVLFKINIIIIFFSRGGSVYEQFSFDSHDKS